MSQALAAMLKQAEQSLVPLSILFELTNRCNEDCTHCYVDLGDIEGELTTEEVTDILDQLRAMGTLFLTFTGGEIFTRKDILVLVRHARSLGFALRLFTNGTLLRDRDIEVLAEASVIGVEMSLYAMDPQAHDKVTRIPGSWNKTTNAARRLRAAGVPVVLKAPIMAGISREYAKVLAFAREIGAEYRFDPTLIVRNDLDDSPLDHRMSRADLLGFCMDPHLGQAVAPGTGHKPEPGQSICATARRVALISSRGRVYPCSQRFPPAGSLREQSFKEIWETSPLLLRLRNITAQDLPVCSGCEQNSFCGRCSLDALFEDGDFFGPNTWRCELGEIRVQAYEKGGTTELEKIHARIQERARSGGRLPALSASAAPGSTAGPGGQGQ
ncbi:MAG: radical SAM protein [Acidobacteriota bacterium]|nr:radical SAM protein [Acidobacteriota bacterium]